MTADAGDAGRTQGLRSACPINRPGCHLHRLGPLVLRHLSLAISFHTGTRAATVERGLSLTC